jgi:DNA repair exonuclease SbcCD ATPase subunit
LFFDGPIFGLYKYAARPMLNKTSSEGQLKILFSRDNEYYLIIRQLQHGKKKDKVQSQFFRVEYNKTRVPQTDDKEVIQMGDHIQHLIDVQAIVLDEIIFKSDTELQNTIQDLLPPKEVLTTTQFLLQDSDNFFAMTPADRITVFKNIFNLLSIDDAKDKIAEERRDIQSRIRIMQDSDESDKHLQ